MRHLAGLCAALGLALALLAGWLLVPRAGVGGPGASLAPGPEPVREASPAPALRTRGGPPLVATTPEELREVVVFAREAGPEQVETLTAMALDSSDPLVVGNALRALGRLGVAARDERLLALLDDARPRVRQDAVVALGLCADPDAAVHLAPLLAGNDATLRTLAIQALGRIGGEHSRKLLESVRTNAQTTVVEHTFLRDALVAIGPGGRQPAPRSRSSQR